LCRISFDLVTLTFELSTLAVSDELRAWNIQLTYQFLASYDYPFLSYAWLNLITLPSPGTVTAPCHVTYHREPKMFHNVSHFLNPWAHFTYSLCHFQGATTKIKLCYMRKIACIPLWRLQSSLRIRSITWPVHRGPPKTTRNNFLTSNCLFTTQLLWGYDDD